MRRECFTFAINPPENNKIPKDLPAPSGILGNKLKKSDVEALSLLLDKNDIYVYDDFIYCLIVTKNENIYKDIISEVQKLINS